MLLSAVAFLVAAQAAPAKVVELSATLGGKPYGRVTYIRGIVAGKGMERTVILDVDEEGAKYRVEEKRTYANGGLPTSVVRKVTEGTRTVTVTLVYSALTAKVTITDGGESETEDFKLEVENAKTADPSQFWLFGSAPEKNAKVVFWEYSLDENKWVERTVTYTGTAELKIGEKTVTAHRISLGKDVNFYTDEFGMPFKSSQETAKGTLTLVRTNPPVEDRP